MKTQKGKVAQLEASQRALPSGLPVTFFAGAKKVTKESTCIKVFFLPDVSSRKGFRCQSPAKRVQ